MTLTNWAAIAAKGTSYKVSVPSSEQIAKTTAVGLSKMASQANQENDDSNSTVLSSSGSTSSSNDENSSRTVSTANVVTTSTMKSTPTTNPVSYTGETVQKQIVPAATPAQNPWKIEKIIREREERMENLRLSLSPDLLTPAESKDIKVVVKDPTAMPRTPSETLDHKNSKSHGKGLKDTDGETHRSRKGGSSSKTLNSSFHNHTTSQIQNQGKNVYAKKGIMKDGSVKKSSIQAKSKLKKSVSPSIASQDIQADVTNIKEDKDLTSTNSAAVIENSTYEPSLVSSSDTTSNTPTSSTTFEIKSTEVESNSNNTGTISTQSAAATSSKKNSSSKPSNPLKSNISSSYKTKNGTNNKTKKNISIKKNRTKKSGGNLKNNFSNVPTPEEMEALRVAAVAQIEYFFTIDELVKNIYIRKHMDCDGYLPAAVIFNFPSVLSFCIPYYDLLAAVDTHAKSIEVDFKNECLRVKGGEAAYKKWLMPNPDGTLGCPKWIKETQPYVDGVIVEGKEKERATNKSDFSAGEEEKKEDYECAPHVANAGSDK